MSAPLFLNLEMFMRPSLDVAFRDLVSLCPQLGTVVTFDKFYDTVVNGVHLCMNRHPVYRGIFPVKRKLSEEDDDDEEEDAKRVRKSCAFDGCLKTVNARSNVFENNKYCSDHYNQVCLKTMSERLLNAVPTEDPEKEKVAVSNSLAEHMKKSQTTPVAPVVAPVVTPVTPVAPVVAPVAPVVAPVAPVVAPVAPVVAPVTSKSPAVATSVASAPVAQKSPIVAPAVSPKTPVVAATQPKPSSVKSTATPATSVKAPVKPTTVKAPEPVKVDASKVTAPVKAPSQPSKAPVVVKAPVQPVVKAPTTVVSATASAKPKPIEVPKSNYKLSESTQKLMVSPKSKIIVDTVNIVVPPQPSASQDDPMVELGKKFGLLYEENGLINFKDSAPISSMDPDLSEFWKVVDHKMEDGTTVLRHQVTSAIFAKDNFGCGAYRLLGTVESGEFESVEILDEDLVAWFEASDCYVKKF